MLQQSPDSDYYAHQEQFDVDLQQPQQKSHSDVPAAADAAAVFAANAFAASSACCFSSYLLRSCSFFCF
ncbi:hypothetical protein [Klebsiella pneumoniae]|uniref:hypothetical protein n=1 Tax=Klebsiella pneumoniae TaxID=573 RepID=UPI002B3FFCFC|nr:hypothetical protein [Klebsiella pneumoniae]